MIIGKNGVTQQAQKAKYITEVSEIQERLNLKVQENQLNAVVDNGVQQHLFGNINEILGINNPYSEELIIENGKLAYIENKVSKQKKAWLEEKGILAQNNYYLVMNEESKSNFTGQTNLGTIEEFRNLVNEGRFEYDIAYLLEDIVMKDTAWIPIGTNDSPFSKQFDGNNCKIKNMKIQTSEAYYGLFGYGDNATIKNITLIDAKVVSSKTEDAFLGGIIGSMLEGNIENCHAKGGTISAQASDVGGIAGSINLTNVKKCSNNMSIISTGKYAIGGIVGWAKDKCNVEESYNTGDITGNKYVAGIVGTFEFESNMISCENRGNIIANTVLEDSNISDVGGLVGRLNKNAHIVKSKNTGKVNGNGIGVGGIAGVINSSSTVEQSYNEGRIGNVEQGDQVGAIAGRALIEGKIIACYNKEEVLGKTAVGGILGHLGYSTGKAYINNCYNMGNISSKDGKAGGITGIIYTGEINNCYNIGEIVNKNGDAITDINKNSLLEKKISNCFYKQGIYTNGISNSEFIEGISEAVTIEEMKEENFIERLNRGNDQVYWKEDKESINQGYPLLSWQ